MNVSIACVCTIFITRQKQNKINGKCEWHSVRWVCEDEDWRHSLIVAHGRISVRLEHRVKTEVRAIKIVEIVAKNKLQHFNHFVVFHSVSITVKSAWCKCFPFLCVILQLKMENILKPVNLSNAFCVAIRLARIFILRKRSPILDRISDSFSTESEN